MTERDLAALAADVGTAEDPREALRRIAALRTALAAGERAQVARALAAGASFASIGRELGISRQAVHRRFADLAPSEGDGLAPAPPAESGPPPANGLSVTPEARLVLRHASAEARAAGDQALGGEHVLLALLRPGSALPALDHAGLTLSRARTQVRAASTGSRVFSLEDDRPDAHELLAATAREARARGVEQVTPELLLRTALADGDSAAVRTLRALGADPDAVIGRLAGASVV
jgi:hypothetical protein